MRHREGGSRYLIVVYVIVILTISHFVVGFPSLYHFLYLWRMLRGLFGGWGSGGASASPTSALCIIDVRHVWRHSVCRFRRKSLDTLAREARCLG